MKNLEIVQGVVRKINKTHFIVDLNDGQTGLVHISEISDYYVSKIDTMFQEGKKYTFIVIKDDGQNRVKLSWKSLKPRFQKDPFNFVLQETQDGFEKLLKNTNEEIEND